MGTGHPLLSAAEAALRRHSPQQIKAALEGAIIIVSAPRAGSNLLFEQLSKIAGVWTIGGESHGIFRAFPHLYAENRDLDSGCLVKSHADPETRKLVRACFLALLRDHRGSPYLEIPPGDRPAQLAWLEKTPRNALNIPFLLEVFPRARFIYLYRDPRQNIASIIEAWELGLRTGRFVTFRDLPGWSRQAWCFLLPRGWRSMKHKSLAEIAAFQWAASNDSIIENLAVLEPSRWASLGYEELIDKPGETLSRLSEFCGAESPQIMNDALPLSRTTLSPPHPDKWKKHEQEIGELLPGIDGTIQRIRALGRD